MRSTPKQFKTDIRRLIDEVEAHLVKTRGAGDREYRLQREAFEERRARARQLASEISADQTGQQWNLRDGDARRIEDALRLSLDFFRPAGGRYPDA